jgi:SagB-type dehydrogenase family enzyme
MPDNPGGDAPDSHCSDIASLKVLYPHFLDELVVIPFEDGLIVDGNEQMRTLRGAATSKIIPRLMALMDGSRTFQQLETALPEVPSEDLRRIVSALVQNGMVETGPCSAPVTTIATEDTLGFFRRFVGATACNRNGYSACARLDMSHVVIIVARSELSHGERLRSSLQSTGHGTVTICFRELLLLKEATAACVGSTVLLVSLSVTEEATRWHYELDSWCVGQRLPWLRLVVDDRRRYVDIGPLFTPWEAACFCCFNRVHSPEDQAPGPHTPINLLFWISMAAIEITYLVSRVGPPMSGIQFRRFDLRLGTSKSLRHTRLHGCPVCCPIPPDLQIPRGDEAKLHTAILFEEYVGTETQRYFDPKALADRAALGATLSRETKRYPHSTQHRLHHDLSGLDVNVFDVLSCKEGIRTPLMTRQQLASVLELTAGLRNTAPRREGLQRWAATAGNLGSVELFAFVRSVEGLSPGLYFYQPQEHSIVRVTRVKGGLDVEDLMYRAVHADSFNLPDVLIVFTSAFHRLARKYGPFGYRLANLDAGVALAQLHITARSLGLHSETATCWADDLLENQLNLEPFAEQVAVVAGVSHSACGAKATTTMFPSGPGLYRNIGPAKPPKAFYGKTSTDLLTEIFQESRIQEKDLPIRCDLPHEQASGRCDRSLAVSLPKVPAEASFVLETLSLRTSTREFSSHAVSLEQLSTILRYAKCCDSEACTGLDRKQELLMLYVLVWSVRGLTPGVYIYREKEHALVSVMPEISEEDRKDLLVGFDNAMAPLQVWIVGNLVRACAFHGALGHRQVLLSAGVVANRIYLAALGMGLMGSIVAGLVRGGARRTMGLDGYERAGLIAVAVGTGMKSAAL